MTESLTAGLLHDAEALYARLDSKMSPALSTRFLGFLSRLYDVQKAGIGASQRAQADALATDLSAVLIGLSEEKLWDAPPSANGAAKPLSGVTPEIRAWAAQLFTEEEHRAGLREIRETGGFEFHEFVHELQPRKS